MLQGMSWSGEVGNCLLFAICMDSTAFQFNRLQLSKAAISLWNMLRVKSAVACLVWKSQETGCKKFMVSMVGRGDRIGEWWCSLSLLYTALSSPGVQISVPGVYVYKVSDLSSPNGSSKEELTSPICPALLPTPFQHLLNSNLVSLLSDWNCKGTERLQC